MGHAAAGVPLVDVSAWFSDDESAKDALAREVDEVLQRVGFMVVVGHGVPRDFIERVRGVGREFFALPAEAKERYRTEVAGRGWLAIGAEANGYSEGTETPPDLKESYVVGSEAGATTDPEDPFAAFYGDNVWPGEVPGFQPLVVEYLARMRELADSLLSLCARALGLPDDYFSAYTEHPSWAYQFNWYPSRAHLGEPEEGQFRIGPHTDFGTLTLLDRQPGDGGLQVDIAGEGWVDAPHVPGALIVNTGDLLARWTGERWQSNRHRVLPPPASAPEEELMSLVYFYEADPGSLIEPLAPPVGRRSDLSPVLAGDFIRERYDAITMT